MKKKENQQPEAPETAQESAAPQTPQDAPAEPEQASAEPEKAEGAEKAQPGEASVEQWQAALETAVQQRDGYLDSLRRTQADFQNFKRRNQTARSDGYADGVCESLTAILPAIDNLERALDAADKAGQNGALADGVKMTLTTLLDGLKRFGFEEIPAQGETFNPELHNAVMREAGDQPGKVLEVFQKGYRVKDRIIRYAMVKVCAE